MGPRGMRLEGSYQKNHDHFKGLGESAPVFLVSLATRAKKYSLICSCFLCSLVHTVYFCSVQPPHTRPPTLGIIKRYSVSDLIATIVVCGECRQASNFPTGQSVCSFTAGPGTVECTVQYVALGHSPGLGKETLKMLGDESMQHSEVYNRLC